MKLMGFSEHDFVRITHMRPFFDVRMRGFRERTPVADALAILYSRTQPLHSETITISTAANRVLAVPVIATLDVPGFTRSAMDGYAVRAQDTSEATARIPLPLDVIGESLPARPFLGTIHRGQAVRITTGAPLPSGADAVLMAEQASEVDGRVWASSSVIPGKHVGGVGEDISRGREVLPAGRRLRPQDVGLIAAVGDSTVSVIRRPRVALLMTGEELLPPGSMPQPYHIIDSNSPMLTALVTRDGGECLPVRYVPDRYEMLRDAIGDTEAEVILISGGSSVGSQDHAPRAIAERGELAIHGIAIRPAGPTGIGFHTVRPGLASGSTFTPSVQSVVLLPGNPVSCLCAYDLFAGRVVRRLGGRAWELPYQQAGLPLAADILSVRGRMDYVRVKITDNLVYPLATTGASILSSTVLADGFVLIEDDRERLAAGERVSVWCYD